MGISNRSKYITGNPCMCTRWFFSWSLFMIRYQLQISDLGPFDIEVISKYSNKKQKYKSVDNALLQARRETEYSLAYIMKEDNYE